MQSSNKKIKNATKIITDNIIFKSKLEALVYNTLMSEGFAPKYEATKYVIWEGGKPSVPFFNKDRKTGLLKRDTKVLLPITYTPDFEFEYDGTLFIIEAKGLENDLFPVKKKMFRKHLETLGRPVVYFEIYSKRQLLEAIEIIKVMNKITKIRQYFKYLPEKDQKLAEEFLDKRKFVELKELIDSDAEKMARKRYRLIANEVPERKENEVEEEIQNITPEQREFEMKFDAIKELQSIVSEQAAPFIEMDERFYDPTLTEIEYYD